MDAALDFLNLTNINEYSVFPDLAGIAGYLKKESDLGELSSITGSRPHGEAQFLRRHRGHVSCSQRRNLYYVRPLEGGAEAT